MEEWQKGIETRIDQINDRVTGMENWAAGMKEDTAAILKVIGGASKFGRLVKVHGPRVFAAVVGWAIATGKVDQEFAQMLRTIFVG